MMPSLAQLHWFASFLDRLPFVTWDRCTVGEDELTVYGWIDRLEYFRSDFVVLTFSPLAIGQYPGFTTSSAKRSLEIHRALYSPLADIIDDSDHRPCQRVEDVFGDLVERKVVLP